MEEKKSDILIALHRIFEGKPDAYLSTKEAGIHLYIFPYRHEVVVGGVKIDLQETFQLNDNYAFVVMGGDKMIMGGHLEMDPTNIEGYAKRVEAELLGEGFNGIEVILQKPD
ncbi:MAG TPA: hypothetical protein VJI46_03950 [Candidatus Nanoarchaeia archaeon]|nr:hypothetical protein [Candidatus Nanoarchaeia archaeon]